MTAPSRPPPSLAPLLHLLAGMLLGTGLVGAFLLRVPEEVEQRRIVFRSVVVTTAASWGVFGAVGGLLGGLAVGSTRSPGVRFWMVALGAGGALTFGAIAVRDTDTVLSGDGGGPAGYVLTWLVVGWLAGVLMGAVGAAFARAASPAVAAVLRQMTGGQPDQSARLVGTAVAGVAWAAFWGVLVALLAVLAVAVVLLSVRAGGTGPALAVGGTCGCVFFGLRYALSTGG
jgi:hypothetical protein